MLINVQANMVLDVYNGYLTDFTQIQTYHIGPNCSGIAEVWRLEFQTLTSTYIIRSALSGSNAWQHSMHTNGTAPYLHLGVSSDAYWFVVRVSGTNHWNIYNRDYNSTGRSSLRNTGITSGNGGRNLELAPLDPSDIAQRWELFVCP
ncbi:uncharacterized protein LOC118436839 [Folsomia candida]|nr:uncharacterized protein LOC118436839 [Folsomia candida]